jgi:hypothetical protein
VITLDLHACGLDDALLLHILPVLATQCPGLRELDLSGNALTGAVMGDLVATVLQSDTLRLQRLHLAGIKLKQDGLRTLAAGVSGHAFLEELDVTDTGADQDGLHSLFDALQVCLVCLLVYLLVYLLVCLFACLCVFYTHTISHSITLTNNNIICAYV